MRLKEHQKFRKAMTYKGERWLVLPKRSLFNRVWVSKVGDPKMKEKPHTIVPPSMEKIIHVSDYMGRSDIRDMLVYTKSGDQVFAYPAETLREVGAGWFDDEFTASLFLTNGGE